MKISIICVCFNSQETIGDCITSILKQTYKNSELVIIDGNSTDKTLSIIENFKQKMPNLKVISEKDKGVYDAMNKGIKIASGDVIGFLNSDDFYPNQGILNEVSQSFINDAKIDGCYSDLIYVDRKRPKKIVRYWQPHHFVKGSFSKGWMVPHPTFFARKVIYNKYGNFDLKYNLASDVDLMIRFFEIKRINFKYIPKIFVYMRLGGITNQSIKNIYLQNIEILRSLRSHNLQSNLFIFLFFKIIHRLKQYFFNRFNL